MDATIHLWEPPSHSSISWKLPSLELVIGLVRDSEKFAQGAQL